MTWQTHTVFNQPNPLSNSNLYLSDTPLQEAVAREQAEWDSALLSAVGLQLGSAESLELGRMANANPPELLRYDAAGRRVDEVRFHPSWHMLMQGLTENRVHNLPWQNNAVSGSFAARAARFLLHSQVESGTLCPITMTFGAIPLLQKCLPTSMNGWLMGLASNRYDPHSLPAEQKKGLLIGMGMTEKQGGSDVLTNTTQAIALEGKGSGKPYRLVGHKWFFSVPQSDAHLILAQASGGISCFFVPRILPDGTRNAIRIERLKEKLGNRSNASAEVEFQDATGWLLGDEGDGVRLILQMGSATRFDCALGSHGLMRRAFTVAFYHALQRQAFGKSLAEQPLMRQVLAKMALRLEGQTSLLFRLCRSFEMPDVQGERLFGRLMTPAAKFAVCKQGIPFVAEAMEALGGIGYCEESELSRLYREMPVNSIWEGSGNIMCLDVLRVWRKNPHMEEMLSLELADVKGQNVLLDKAWRNLLKRLHNPSEAQARIISDELFNINAAAQLLRFAPTEVAEAWCQQYYASDGASVIDNRTQDLLLQRAMGLAC